MTSDPGERGCVFPMSENGDVEMLRVTRGKKGTCRCEGYVDL